MIPILKVGLKNNLGNQFKVKGTWGQEAGG